MQKRMQTWMKQKWAHNGVQQKMDAKGDEKVDAKKDAIMEAKHDET